MDLTGIENEEDVADDRMIDDTEVNENVREDLKEVNTESLIAEVPNVEEPISVNPPHTKSVVISSIEPENVDKDPTADLPPRKCSKRDPRISRVVVTETRTTQELTLPVTFERPPIQYTPTPLSPAIIEFIQNERATMFMPAPKPGEGSIKGPSGAGVVRAAELLQAAAMEAEATAKPSQERTHEASSSYDSDELLADNEMSILMRRITALEKHKIFKDA
ncbi:hypothetical protein HanPSC8_Chr11g0492321 [Helianthus annuus]|nr:hypothetical protein HanPSC8_Chr11g0492321 [Helianthus annuus]